MTRWIHSDPNADDGYWSGEGAQRACARGEHCASRDHSGEPALGPRVLCSADRDLLVGAIERLPGMYLELYLRLGDKGTGEGPRVSGGGRSAPIPIRLDISTLMADIAEILTSWDARVRTVARLDMAGADWPRRDSIAMTTTCRILATHVDALLALEPETMNRCVSENAVSALPDDTDGHVRPAGWAITRRDLDGGDAAKEIFDLHRRCRSKLGYTRKDVLLRSRCWQCDAAGKLVRYDGSAGLDDHVTCQACRTEYVGDRLARLMADEERIERELAQGKKAS